MFEESTSPDLVELLRQQLDAWNGRDFDALMSFDARNAAEWTQGQTSRVGNYTDIDEARAAAEPLAQERG